jgi:IclR helix-turn-helix domain
VDSLNPAGIEPVWQQLQSTAYVGQPGVLHSAFAVLRVLGRMQFPVGVTMLAAETGIPKTTVHRLLEQLADENVAERDERRWVLGTGLQISTVGCQTWRAWHMLDFVPSHRRRAPACSSTPDRDSAWCSAEGAGWRDIGVASAASYVESVATRRHRGT